jgi:hypothetical protein
MIVEMTDDSIFHSLILLIDLHLFLLDQYQNWKIVFSLEMMLIIKYNDDVVKLHEDEIEKNN